MAFDTNSSPELKQLASDIQQAVSAYAEFQTQLAGAIKPWNDAWTSILEAAKPLSDTMRLIAATMAAAREQRVELRDAIAQTNAIIANEIRAAGLRFRHSLERADHIGQLGWTLKWTMMPADIVRLSTIEVVVEADAYMREWYETEDADLTTLEQRILDVKELEPFQKPITQCFAAYRREEYAITIPCLVAVLERGIRQLGPADHFYNTRVERLVKDQYDKAREDDPDAIEVFIWLSVYAFIRWFYAQYGPTRLAENRMFRHGIQHGTQPPPNEKVEVLRLFHALDTITSLYRRQVTRRAAATPGLAVTVGSPSEHQTGLALSMKHRWAKAKEAGTRRLTF
jgi:hypothetical protein